MAQLVNNAAAQYFACEQKGTSVAPLLLVAMWNHSSSGAVFFRGLLLMTGARFWHAGALPKWSELVQHNGGQPVTALSGGSNLHEVDGRPVNLLLLVASLWRSSSSGAVFFRGLASDFSHQCGCMLLHL